MALSEEVDFLYKCTDYYAPQHERSIRWDDPRLGVRWPLSAGQAPILSAKDAVAPLFQDAETFP
jgi:dTDP-4-dehydrorhamnose 3,5-epimerase